MGSNIKQKFLGGKHRYGTVAKFRVLVLIIFCGSVIFLLNSNAKQSQKNFESSVGNVSLSHVPEYFPINLEYGKWAGKLVVEADTDMTDDTPQCDFMDYIFGMPVSQTDPCLIEAVKEKFLIQPPAQNTSHQNKSLQITDKLPTNKEKFKWVEKLLIENSTDGRGFYIECGANDGSFISPTIRLERTYNWTGLLIEANPVPFQKLLEKKRNAYAVNAALCIGKSPQPITFFTNPKNTGVSGINMRKNLKATVNVTVQCIPFYSVLKALDLKSVDYLSLDVEGLELDILKTLPFGNDTDDGEEIIFKVMTIEHWSVPGGEKALRDFLEPKGYKFIKNMRDKLTRDSLFVHETLYEKAKGITIEIAYLADNETLTVIK